MSEEDEDDEDERSRPRIMSEEPVARVCPLFSAHVAKATRPALFTFRASSVQWERGLVMPPSQSVWHKTLAHGHHGPYVRLGLSVTASLSVNSDQLL